MIDGVAVGVVVIGDDDGVVIVVVVVVVVEDDGVVDVVVEDDGVDVDTRGVFGRNGRTDLSLRHPYHSSLESGW